MLKWSPATAQWSGLKNFGGSNWSMSSPIFSRISTSAMFPAFTASVRLRDMVMQVASKLVDKVSGEEVGD